MPFTEEQVYKPTAKEERAYEPKDAIAQTLQAVALTGGAGLLASAVQNSLAKQNVGVWGVFTRTGGTISIFGLDPALVTSQNDMTD